MLPSLRLLCRERTLLLEVLRAAGKEASAEEYDSEGNGQDSTCAGDSKVSAKSIASIVADRLQGRDNLQDLPPELLVDIAEHFLESPIWHLCQLGETSEHLGKVFNDETLWQGFLETRFREASRSPRRRAHRSPSPASARRTYAELHSLERRFSGGHFSTQGTLDNPRQGVAVLDLRIAPGPVSTCAFAALGDGSVMVYDLDPANASFVEDDSSCVELERKSIPPIPMQEFSHGEGGGPALCCLPIERCSTDQCSHSEQQSQAPPLMLAAGYALGRLKAWDVPAGQPIVVEAWEQAHAGRITALAALGGNSALLSASGDGLVKAWDLGSDRFGDHRQTFPGHRDSVVSVAASSFDRHTLLTGSHDRSLRLWDARMGGSDSAEVASWRQQDWVTCVDFHPTSEYLIFSSDKCVHTWDIRKNGGLPVASSHRHRKLVSRFRVDPLRLVSCSLDGCVKVSSLEDPCVRRASPRSTPTSSPALGPASSPVAFGDLPLIDGGSETCTLRTSNDYVLCIDFDSTRLLTGGVNGQMNTYDFSDSGNFRLGTPAMSPVRKRCGQSVEFHLEGLQEIEV